MFSTGSEGWLDGSAALTRGIQEIILVLIPLGLIFLPQKGCFVNMNKHFHEPSPLRELFLSDVPEELLLAFPRMLRQASQQAFDAKLEVELGARRDVYPHERRAFANHGLVSLAQRFAAEGVTARETLNASRNDHHVEMVSGSVILLAAAVESDGTLVRDAVYRRSITANPQLVLPASDFERAGSELDDPLVAVILYGPSSAFPHSAAEVGPAFVTARFPYHDWSGYSEDRIDLLARMHQQDEGRKPNWSIDVDLWHQEEHA